MPNDWLQRALVDLADRPHGCIRPKPLQRAIEEARVFLSSAPAGRTPE